MKAIIMAGGEGSRLRPLTCDCPKPMLRLLNRPLMEYAVQLLKKHEISSIAATLGYLPDSIMDYFGDGDKLGVQLHYYIENRPLGTAGSVKQAQAFLNERFIVLSGDGITDIDLRAALQFHHKKRALATLILKKSARPQEYGMVVTTQDGRIRAFHEKPGRSDIYSDLINTGIYILEPEIMRYIPENRPFDFGHDLFPALLEKNLPVYGFAADGYWCDVGDVAAYLRVHADALDGRIRLDGLAPSIPDAYMEYGTTIEAPVYISPGARIEKGARIGAYTVIGEGCTVATGADIKRSLLLDGAHAENGAQLRGCILGRGAIAGDHARLFEESVAGTDSCIGKCATLPPGVKLWPGKELPEGECPEENIIWGSLREQRFINGKLMLQSPAQAARAAQACICSLQPKEIIIGRNESSVAAALWHAAASGAMAQGVQVIDAGKCTLPQLRSIQRALHADAALMIAESFILPLNPNGSRISEKQQREILKIMERQDFARPFSSITHAMMTAGGTDMQYIAESAACFSTDARLAAQIQFHAQRPLLADLAARTFDRAGLRIKFALDEASVRPMPDELGLYITENGETACFSDEHGALNDVQRQLACAWTALELGEKRLILPNHATRSIEHLAPQYGAHAIYLPGENAVWMDMLARESPLQFDLQFDGLRFSLAFLSTLVKNGFSLDQWRRRMPVVWRSTRQLHVPIDEAGRLLHALAENESHAEMGGGLRLSRQSGWAWLSPDDGAQLNLFAESADMESAQELCSFYDGEIQKLLAASRIEKRK